MTDLERRALLGDRQAQEECTRQGILLPCWRCGGEAEVKELHTGGKPVYAVACKKHHCGAYGAGSVSVPKAIEFWNTRPGPPVERREECKNAGEFGDWSFAICKKKKSEHHNFTVKRDDFCNYFAPKEEL